jgi:hypothetical protein
VLYFPHIADGGPAAGQWQTRFSFVNSNNSPVSASLYLSSDNGAPLNLSFGTGLNSRFDFSIAPYGTIVFASTIASPLTVTGWAVVLSTLPLQGTVAFRLIRNGSAAIEITANPTDPSRGYTSVATPQLGVAVANIDSQKPLGVLVTASYANGVTAGQATLMVPAGGHSSFNLSTLIPSLPANFSGSVRIVAQTPGQWLLAWALYSDNSGVISSLPEGRDAFPKWQTAEIGTAFANVVSALQQLLPDFGGVPTLNIGAETDNNAINAFASGGNIVQINLALAQLISDSPSELAFAIAHEVGHIYQQRTGKFLWSADKEWDADHWGLLGALQAGYDPYGAAGTLGKLGMATGTANLGVQQWEDSQLATDAHGSFSTRINNLTSFIQFICGYSSQLQASCAAYKQVVHPNFPPSPLVPLDVRAAETEWTGRAKSNK